METWFIEGYDKYNIYNYCCMKAENKVDAILKATEVFGIIAIEKVYKGK